MKKMKKMMALVLLMLVLPFVSAVSLSVPIGISLSDSCPEILGNPEYYVQVNTDPTLVQMALDNGWAGRSYAFEGETVQVEFDVEDTNGISQSCTVASVVFDDQESSFEAACIKTSSTETQAHYECNYVVSSAQEVSGEFWIYAKVTDSCSSSCQDFSMGLVSLYLNPVVSVTMNSQKPFGLFYDSSGNDISEYISAGDTVYSPTFTIENTADPASGVYMFLEIYGNDFYDIGTGDALCPTSNVLDIKNVDYSAYTLTDTQGWTTMYEGESNKDVVFTSNLGSNFLGVGDDITMKLRLNIPNPCYGDFTDSGEVVFIGRVI